MHDATDPALQPAPINLSPGPAYASRDRRFQGIPGIERAPNGRLWAVWYGGGLGEGPDNYVMLATRAPDADAWTEPILVIDPPGAVRAFDPCLWHDPLGRLWLFWAQSEGLYDGRAGVWCIRCADSGRARPTWSAPRRIANGVMMNKPTVLSTGEWLLPTAVWAYREPHRPELADERYSNALCTEDEGETFFIRGGADVPERQFDEHMIVERRDRSLWMLVRTRYGIGESISRDGGRTWSAGRPTGLGGPGSRFFIRRLRSGRLLLVNHVDTATRNNLAAMLSDDDGHTWYGRLMIDARDQVSYPDGVEDEDGHIYIIHDRERQADKEILLALFTEEDVVRSGREPLAVSHHEAVNQAGGAPVVR